MPPGHRRPCVCLATTMGHLHDPAPIVLPEFSAVRRQSATDQRSQTSLMAAHPVAPTKPNRTTQTRRHGAGTVGPGLARRSAAATANVAARWGDWLARRSAAATAQRCCAVPCDQNDLLTSLMTSAGGESISHQGRRGRKGFRAPELNASRASRASVPPLWSAASPVEAQRRRPTWLRGCLGSKMCPSSCIVHPESCILTPRTSTHLLRRRSACQILA